MTTENENGLYGDVPAGGASSNVGGFIGHGKISRRWLLGWVAEEREINGVKYPKGFAYFNGDQKVANKICEGEFGSEYDAKQVLVVTMPSTSFTNMSDENKAKFEGRAVSSHSQVIGTESKYGAALNLVTMLSFVDAYARQKGWYTESLVNFGGLRNIEETEDTTDVLTDLNAQRAAVWSALGETDSSKTFRVKTDDKKGTQAPKLREALAKLMGSEYTGWMKFAQVFDPSEGAWNKNKNKRFQIPCIVALYDGEKSAVDAGKAELAARAEREGASASSNGNGAEREGASASSNGNGADYVALFAKLSAKGKETYNEKDWVATAPVIRGDLEAVGGKGAKAPALIKIAKEYELDKADIELVQATF